MTDRTLTPGALADLSYDADGLVPVVAQDAQTGRVLMLAYANAESLQASFDSGFMTFWSRSRGELWRKGETSGNLLRVVSLHGDCDSDAIVAMVVPTGPACHTGEATCFGKGTGATLDRLWTVIEQRREDRPAGSYTTKLLDDENLRLKKLGEETAELVTAFAKGDDERSAEEAADLVYHLLAALAGSGVELRDVLDVLEKRAG